MNGKYLIEYRSGSYFPDLQERMGVSMKAARQFESKQDAEDFMKKNCWIYFYGGMVVPFKDS